MDPQTFIENYLSHEYDPVKAREYYLRTRKLKGRKPGKGVAPAGSSPKAAVAPAKKAVAAPAKKAAPKGANRMQELNARLTRLKEILDLLDSKVAAAQARSGVTGVAKKTAAKKTASSSKETSTDKKTGTEKKAEAKAAKERYEKNKKGESTKSAQAVQDEIEEVQKKIADARDELKAALAKARASSPKPKTAVGRPTKSKEGDRQNGA